MCLCSSCVWGFLRGWRRCGGGVSESSSFVGGVLVGGLGSGLRRGGSVERWRGFSKYCVIIRGFAQALWQSFHQNNELAKNSLLNYNGESDKFLSALVAFAHSLCMLNSKAPFWNSVHLPAIWGTTPA